ncbi:MAG: hypothetical protein JRI65_07545 [Deltaproteobacteria bacterium]|nr:hypothetical protein [Deltaproteobacteria bacterium]
MGKYGVEERLSWRWWVTPKPLMEKPIHRWCVFPHSFTSELVHGLIEEWGLGANDHLLDPFAGAGTTLLAAKEKGVPATGYDLSPHAVFATHVKIADYNLPRLENTWGHIRKTLKPSRWNGPVRSYPELVQKALPGKLLGAFDALDRDIKHLGKHKTDRDFFRLALISVLPYFSRAVATGGWLKWVKKREGVSSLPATLSARVELMIGDLRRVQLPVRDFWHVAQADARRLPDKANTYSAVITSPPYPNRHDYTRVFGVELMFGFLDWEETRRLRYQSIHSHPEAKPERPSVNGYVPPKTLVEVLQRIRGKGTDARVPKMLEGYFLDLYLCLCELKRVCRPKCKIAIVVGNAQYFGVPVLVDELTAEVGEQSGLTCEKLVVARYRGNSAQQMGKYGRNPSRESVVVFIRS